MYLLLTALNLYWTWNYNFWHKKLLTLFSNKNSPITSYILFNTLTVSCEKRSWISKMNECVISHKGKSKSWIIEQAWGQVIFGSVFLYQDAVEVYIETKKVWSQSLTRLTNPKILPCLHISTEGNSEPDSWFLILAAWVTCD